MKKVVNIALDLNSGKSFSQSTACIAIEKTENLTNAEYLYKETYKFIKSNHELFYSEEDQRPTRTRAEATFKPEDAAAAVN